MYKNSMKIAGILLLAMMFFGCDLAKDEPEVLINNRINGFESAINSGVYANVKTHFHPDMPSNSVYLDPTVLTSGLFNSENTPFVFGTAVVTDGTGNDKIATGSFSHLNLDNATYTAVMREDGDDWKIYSMILIKDGNELTIEGLSQ